MGMSTGMKRRHILGIMAVAFLLLGFAYWGFLQYLKIPEKDISAVREAKPAVALDYRGVSLSVARKKYTAVVECRLQAVLPDSSNPGQKEYQMQLEQCLRGTMPDKEFILCGNALPDETSGRRYLMFVNKMPAEWNVEKGYCIAEEWTYYITENNLLLSCFTSEFWHGEREWDPAEFDGCTVKHFLRYLEWVV